MTTINELGEFNVPEPFDPDARRATAYASLMATEVRKFGRDELAAQVACGICGAKFTPSRYRKKYCSENCRHEARLRSWRRQWERRRER